MTAPAPVTAAFATTTDAVGIIAELDRQIADLEPTWPSMLSKTRMPPSTLSQGGLADVVGARVLGEFGDDPDRYTSPKSRKNYAGTSP